MTMSCKVGDVKMEYEDYGQMWKMAIKTEDTEGDVKTEENDVEFIKIEETEIKYEEDEGNRDFLTDNIDEETGTTNVEEPNVENENSPLYVVFYLSNPQTQELTEPRRSQRQKFYKYCLKPPRKNPCDVLTYSCDQCDYITSYTSSLKKHKLKHCDLSEISVFKCDKCPYESKFEKMLALHQRKHKTKGIQVEYEYKTRSGTMLYDCDRCKYKTRLLDDLKRHQTVHHQTVDKKASEIRMYNCDRCGYATKYKSNLKKHMLRFVNMSKLKTFKCDLCHYQCRYKQSLAYHRLGHWNAPEVRKYKCGECSFETNQKVNLKQHSVRHKKANGGM